MIISKSDCGCSLRVAIELFEPSQVVLVVPIPLVLSHLEPRLLKKGKEIRHATSFIVIRHVANSVAFPRHF